MGLNERSYVDLLTKLREKNKMAYNDAETTDNIEWFSVC